MVALVCAAGSVLQAEDSPVAQEIRGQLEQAVRQHVQQGFGQANLTGEVVAIHLPPNIDGISQPATVRPIRRFLPREAAGRYVIPLEITPAQGKPVKVNLTVECVAVINGWAARFPLKRGSQLDPTNFIRKQIRVSHREQDYFVADCLPEGYQLSASLAQNQLLQFHQFEEVPVVQRGEQVMIHFRRENFTLMSPGKVRREGSIGDLIPVVATATGKRLYARLVSPGIVVVE
ncbi:MAG: flagellar basal body P-ring formation protein FlgA [Fidelibacterota bacterium]|nr:MAG: flagellar basal body P-ring formation protein FlgA [Candidatus Neomarinimicrobiota bacterium]UCH09879.1 MAG: flagellar basal body P-ring formation protein FlgA [Candidatus Neomarinimicrobiota bacterium]